MINRNRIKDVVALPAVLFLGAFAASGLHAQGLAVSVDDSGAYSIGAAGANSAVLKTGVAAEVNNQWLHAADYPKHDVTESTASGELGAMKTWQVTYSGLKGQPDLVYDLRVYEGHPFGDIEVHVRNSTGKTLHVQAIRSVDEMSGNILKLAGPMEQDRILSDSFSENRPAISIYDITHAPEHTVLSHNREEAAPSDDMMHLAVGSQLIYNRESKQSLFFGVLTANRLLTIMRLHLNHKGGAVNLLRYEIEATGTTEMAKYNSLQFSPKEDMVPLNLPVEPNAELSSERLLFSVSNDYHNQLETYGSLIRQIDHARISAPPLMGWWSWTAYYFGLNQGVALSTAEWESQHIKQYGYDVFHVDEGYQFARGEYTTPDGRVFPGGMTAFYSQVRNLGLKPAIWTAPFEISERSWVYNNHPDWLVKNAQGKPIHSGFVDFIGHRDQLYTIDTTNPGAQDYLRRTYATMSKVWGIRYIKLDFMEDTAVEGVYYKPNTTALEAQRIGLQIIRDAVGDNVYLDKDGSPMLTPVGIVDFGRISLDTTHLFRVNRNVATGIAARYYMNRNFFVDDPDAFNVTTQLTTDPDKKIQHTEPPQNYEEAKMSIALSAVSGGMFEIGDDVTNLQHSPERLALIQNADLINMLKLGNSSTPLDLMSYAPEDGMPSIFLLKEDRRQAMLTIFNWSELNRTHTFSLADLGLPAGSYSVTDVLEKSDVLHMAGGKLTVTQPKHTVRVLKLINLHEPAAPGKIEISAPATAEAGSTLHFAAHPTGNDAIISYQWDFGDGVTLEGRTVDHALTLKGDYDMKLIATDLSGAKSVTPFKVTVTGRIPAGFLPDKSFREPDEMLK